MAIGVLFEIPGGTQQDYEELNRKAFGSERGPSEAPEGLIIHTAGASKSGWRIFDAWESQDDFNRFIKQYIEPATEGQPMPDPEIYELTNVIGAKVGATA